MKWLPLKMNYLPLIFQEINFVTEEYINLLNKIRKNNQEKDNSQKNKEKEENQSEEKKEEEDVEISIKKFNGLRESISKRINELEDFYEDNIEDVRVSNFEKARLRLKKLLMYNYDVISKIENSSQQNNIFIKENNEFNKKINEETKRKILENNISNKQLEKEKIKQVQKKSNAKDSTTATTTTIPKPTPVKQEIKEIPKKEIPPKKEEKKEDEIEEDFDLEDLTDELDKKEEKPKEKPKEPEVKKEKKKEDDELEEEEDEYGGFDDVDEDEDLNKLDDSALNRKKKEMDIVYEKNNIKVGDEDFKYDVRKEFDHEKYAAEWDDDSY